MRSASGCRSSLLCGASPARRRRWRTRAGSHVRWPDAGRSARVRAPRLSRPAPLVIGRPARAPCDRGAVAAGGPDRASPRASSGGAGDAARRSSPASRSPCRQPPRDPFRGPPVHSGRGAMRSSSQPSGCPMAARGAPRTDRGWAAGLRLAAIALVGHPRPEEFVAEFSGSDRTVADYLLAEVLERQRRGPASAAGPRSSNA